MTKESAYHHRDLPNALVQHAVDALTENQALPSLRSLAREAGVSPAAVYRHYRNKDELVAAVAEYGFSIMEARFAECVDLSGAAESGEEAFRNLACIGAVYIRFAAEYPELFRTCFGREASAYRASAAPKGRPSTLKYLYHCLKDLHRFGLITEEPEDADVLFGWSLVHGLAGLIDGGVDPRRFIDGFSVEEIGGTLAKLVAAQIRSRRK